MIAVVLPLFFFAVMSFYIQVYDDTEEGSKVCTYYKLDSRPVVMVIDPVTGQKIHSWRGMVQPETLLEVHSPCLWFVDKDHVLLPRSFYVLCF